MTVAIYKWTIDRYHQAVEAGVFDDEHLELLNGELVLMSPEGVPHAGYSSSAAEYLRSLLGNCAKVREGKPITLSNNSEPEPDLAIVEPLEQVYKTQHHPYVENIFCVIEYSNTSLIKDTELKRRTYATEGIREYWVVNLKAVELIVYRNPVNGDYQSQVTLTEGSIRPISFQDISVSVQRLLT